MVIEFFSPDSDCVDRLNQEFSSVGIFHARHNKGLKSRRSREEIILPRRHFVLPRINKTYRRLTRFLRGQPDIFHPFDQFITWKLAWEAIKISLSVKHPPSSVIETRNIKEPRRAAAVPAFERPLSSWLPFRCTFSQNARHREGENSLFLPVTQARFKQILHLLNMQWRVPFSKRRTGSR